MKNDVRNFVIIILSSIGFFIVYLIPGNKRYLLLVLIMLPSILTYLFRIKNYNSKIFYMAFLGIIMVQWLILIYFYLFEVIYANDLLFYLSIAAFIFYILNILYYYPRRGKYSKPICYLIK